MSTERQTEDEQATARGCIHEWIPLGGTSWCEKCGAITRHGAVIRWPRVNARLESDNADLRREREEAQQAAELERVGREGDNATWRIADSVLRAELAVQRQRAEKLAAEIREEDDLACRFCFSEMPDDGSPIKHDHDCVMASLTPVQEETT